HVPTSSSSPPTVRPAPRRTPRSTFQSDFQSVCRHGRRRRASPHRLHLWHRALALLVTPVTAWSGVPARVYGPSSVLTRGADAVTGRGLAGRLEALPGPRTPRGIQTRTGMSPSPGGAPRGRPAPAPTRSPPDPGTPG